MSPTTACKTIGHAISLASSGDSIMVAAATYNESFTISVSLKVIGASASTTIINGGVRISNANAQVTLSDMTIQNHGFSLGSGGGIYNIGALTINKSVINRNMAHLGGGIYNKGMLRISDSTISQNVATYFCLYGYNCPAGYGGGIYSPGGTVTINNSTISGNSAYGGDGGGISIGTGVTVSVNNSTISQNGATCLLILGHCYAGSGGGIWSSGSTTIQNSIVANSSSGGDCNGNITSKGYNLSSDNTCNFAYAFHDLPGTDPLLSRLQNNGGPTQTQGLLSGSPAIDAGNPGGCTDGQGHLLTTDQRGEPRPDPEDTGGCDMGAYERQSD
jgi:hypothetical protein